MLIAALMTSVLLTATSCNAATKISPEEGAEVEMTQEQKELLKKISVDEESVENGELYNWQKEVLNQYNYVLEYLGEKYPSHEFKIVDCAQKNKLNSYSTFWVTADGGEDRYEIYLDVEDSGYTGSDTFYGALIEDDYAKIVCDFLAEDVPECVGCITHMESSVGEDLTEKVTAQEIFEGDYEVSNSTEIYVDGRNSDPDEIAKKIQDKIKEKNLYGSYEIYMLEDSGTTETGEALMEYMRLADKEEVNKILFNCFQEGD